MKCPKCRSENVDVVMDTSGKIKDTSILQKAGRAAMIVGTAGLWALTPKTKGHTKSKPVALCQDCGNKFNP